MTLSKPMAGLPQWLVGFPIGNQHKPFRNLQACWKITLWYRMTYVIGQSIELIMKPALLDFAHRFIPPCNFPRAAEARGFATHQAWRFEDRTTGATLRFHETWLVNLPIWTCHGHLCHDYGKIWKKKHLCEGISMGSGDFCNVWWQEGSNKRHGSQRIVG